MLIGGPLRRWRFLVALFSFFSLSLAVLHAQTPEFRAYWADGFHNGYLSHSETTNLVNDLRNANCNAVVVEVRKRADAYYNSHLEPKASNLSSSDYDSLADLLTLAHDTSDGKQRLEVHAWLVSFNIWSGNITNTNNLPTNSMAYLHPDWMTLDDTGSRDLLSVSSGTTNTTLAFDPSLAEVQRHTFNVAMDIVTNYDVDGINFDYIRYNGANWGYHPTAVARFNAKYDRTGKPSASDPDWMQFRRDQVTALVRRVYLHVLAIKPWVKVSADTITWTPSPTGMSTWLSTSAAYNSVYQDWRGWLQEGILDMAIPMAYFRQTANRQDYINWMNFAKDYRSNRHVIIGPGVYLNDATNAITQMRMSRDPSANGNYAQGVCGYSFAVPEANGTTRARQLAMFQALVQPSTYDTNAVPIFAQKTTIPVMPWKTTPTTGHLKGFVTGGNATNFIDGATISLSGPVNRTCTSDVVGFYGSVDLPPGVYSITATAPTFGRFDSSIAITAGEVSTLNIALPTFDNVPPAIWNVVVTNVTDTSALITWRTDEYSDSVVQFGMTAAYGNTVTSPPLVRTHSMTLSNLTPATVYYCRVVSSDALGNAGTSANVNFVTVRSGWAADIIIDNPAAKKVGTWTTGSSSVDKYGSDYVYRSSGSGSAYLRYTPNIMLAGDYQVFEWHPQGGSRSAAAPYKITYNGGTVTTPVNQQINGGQWNLLGTFNFAAGTNGNVTISDQGGSGLVMADAILFSYYRPSGDLIVDSDGAILTGNWVMTSAGTDHYSSSYYYARTTAGSPSADATYTVTVPRTGKYDVYAWFTSGATRTTRAQALVTGSDGSALTSLDQSTGGGQWQLLAGARDFAAGTSASATLLNNTGEGDKYLIADAVRFLELETPWFAVHPSSIVSTNGGSATFSATVSGSTPLFYQWQKDGVNIPMATSRTFTITNLTVFDAATYTLIASNSVGASYSLPALLTVNFNVRPQTTFALAPNQTVQLQFQGDAGLYQLDVSSNLVDWTTLLTTNSGSFFYTAPVDSAPNRFYRTLLLHP